MTKDFVYLDNAATTQPYPQVVAAIADALTRTWANPSSRHAFGQDAKDVLERSRQVVADALDVARDEVFFTSGGTEANNLAIHGAAWAQEAQAARKEQAARGSQGSHDSEGSQGSHDSAGSQESTGNKVPGHIITTSLEHPSVTKSVRNLKRLGWHVDYIDAKGGNFDWQAFETALCPQTSLVSIMSVQNELGYCFPLARIAQLCHEKAPQALIHTDAVQAFGKLPVHPHALAIDLASISGHKIGGPKGIGALYVKRGTKLYTTAHGGGQERYVRSGTEALPLIAGFAEAVRITFSGSTDAHKRVCELNHFLSKKLKENFRDVIINSCPDGSPFILNFSLPGIANQDMLDRLSDLGVYISIGSACAYNEKNVPPGTWRQKKPLVLQAAGIPLDLAESTFRISFSPNNSKADALALLTALKRCTLPSPLSMPLA